MERNKKHSRNPHEGIPVLDASTGTRQESELKENK